MAKRPAAKPQNRYQRILLYVFEKHWKRGLTEFFFTRDELIDASTELKIKLPKNLGDVVYSVRYRTPLPPEITKTASDGREWVIRAAGTARYQFRLQENNRIRATPNLAVVKVPDSTPEVVGAYALGDEQALLAKVRYNRLIDLFLGITAYSLQNHLRTHVKALGQVEVDELYVGIDSDGAQYAIPVQAKGGSDELGVIQTEQDLAVCKARFPSLICRPVSTLFLSDSKIAMFELVEQDGGIRILRERHYQLVAAGEISEEDLSRYRKSRANPG